MADFLITADAAGVPLGSFLRQLGLTGPRDWRTCRQAGGFYHDGTGWRRIPAVEGGSSDGNL